MTLREAIKLAWKNSHQRYGYMSIFQLVVRFPSKGTSVRVVVNVDEPLQSRFTYYPTSITGYSECCHTIAETEMTLLFNSNFDFTAYDFGWEI